MHIKLRESQIKKALFSHLQLSQPVMEVTDPDQLDTKNTAYHWLTQESLVAKPDVFISKRGKNGFVLLDKPLTTVQDWINEQFRQVKKINGAEVILDQFVVEPFFPHQPNEEFYFCIRTGVDDDEILMGRKGGSNVDDSWDRIATFPVGLTKGFIASDFSGFIKRNFNDTALSSGLFTEFILNIYNFFVDWGLSFLEINPLVLTKQQLYILDVKAKVDSAAGWEHALQWEEFFTLSASNLPADSARKAEEYIAQLDAASGASLKLRVLNLNGSIWPLVAGGGASILVADALAQRGLASEIGFYGEYSGNPDTQLMEEYTKTTVDLLLSAQTEKPKYLLIMGGIANFTDIAKTFDGIIAGLTYHAQALRDRQVTVLVRRGGPNHSIGLKKMETALRQLRLKAQVWGPEHYLTEIIWNI
jgi:ATP-citrate lyase beta-subunit